MYFTTIINCQVSTYRSPDTTITKIYTEVKFSRPPFTTIKSRAINLKINSMTFDNNLPMSSRGGFYL